MPKRPQPPRQTADSSSAKAITAPTPAQGTQEAVLQKELQRVANRRRHATCKGMLRPDDSKPGQTQELQQDLTGLALSGGGIRSACFGMGVVSALQHTGLFRSIDYLSTVSGGGYLGAHISSWHARNHEESPSQTSEKPTAASFPFPPREANGPAGRSVRQLIYGGDYIVDGLTAFNKYLIGLLFNNLAVISLMISMAALVALLWRCFDFPVVREHLKLFDLSTDFVVPFIPAALLGTLWVIAWLLSYYRRQGQAPGAFARPLLRLTVGSILIALAMLFGNGDLLLPWRGEGSTAEMIPSTVWLPFVLISVAVLLLIPFIRPGRLIQSAIAPQSPAERWVFRIVTSVMLVVIPMILVGFLGRENISHYFDFQQRGMHEADFKFPEFLQISGRSDFGAPAHLTVAAENAPTKSGDEKSESNQVQQKALSPQTKQEINTYVDELLENWKKANPSQRSALLPIAPASLFATLFKDTAQLFEGVPVPREVRNSLIEPVKNQSQTQPFTQAIHKLQVLSFVLQRLQEQHSNHWLNLQRSSFKAQIDSATPFSERHWDGLTIRIDDYLDQVTSALTFLMFGNENDAQRFYLTDQLYKAGRIEFAAHFTQQILTEPAFTDWLISEADAQLEGEKKEDRQNEAWADTLATARNTARQLRHTNAPKLSLGLANWQLLRACFPEAVTPATRVQRRIVIEADQATRLKIFAVFLIIGLISGWVLNINLTSMHRYYRDRLGETFVVRKSCGSSPLLSELHTTAAGAPYHLINACVSRFGWQEHTLADPLSFGALGDRESDDPRRQDTFVFSQDFVGSTVTGFMPTSDYVKAAAAAGIQLNVDEVVAISGAAVSPARNENPLVAFLMFILNLRLGQWLPNPALGTPRFRPSFLYMLSMLLKSRDKRPYVFLSDGGHAENTGIVELLKRRCRLIIACDAGHDPSHSFADIANAVRLARNLEGIRLVEFDPAPTTAAQTEQTAEWSLEDLSLTTPLQTSPSLPRTTQHFKFARILYPNTEPNKETPAGLLILVKPSITGDEPVDVLEYQRSSPEFPQEPTTDLVFSPAQVESYRQLGYHIGIELAGLFQSPGKPRSESSLVDRQAEDNLWASDAPVGGAKLLAQFHHARQLHPPLPSRRRGAGGEPSNAPHHVSHAPTAP
ncbi:MAG: hypothetical protein ACKO2P_19740 [Planctomycetota bacterium]